MSETLVPTFMEKWEETFNTYTCCFEYTGQTSFINNSPRVLLGALCQRLSRSLWQIHVGSWVKMVLHKTILWTLGLSVGQCLPAGGDFAFHGTFGKVWRHFWSPQLRGWDWHLEGREGPGLLLNILQRPGQFSGPKNYLIPKVSGTTIENPCWRQ